MPGLTNTPVQIKGRQTVVTTLFDEEEIRDTSVHDSPDWDTEGGAEAWLAIITSLDQSARIRLLNDSTDGIFTGVRFNHTVASDGSDDDMVDLSLASSAAIRWVGPNAFIIPCQGIYKVRISCSVAPSSGSISIKGVTIS